MGNNLIHCVPSYTLHDYIDQQHSSADPFPTKRNMSSQSRVSQNGAYAAFSNTDSPPPRSQALASPSQQSLQTHNKGKEVFPDHAEERETSPKIHPLSLAILTAWVVFIIVLLWLLEKAVAAGPTSVSPPWSFTVLPGLFLTVFAQGHSPITAMHLARVAVSSLQYPSSAPRTWRELFWMADRSWAEPVGIAYTAYQGLRLRVRTSVTFILFSTTRVIALITPVILTKAYPMRSVDVVQDIQIRPSTMSFEKMEHVDGYLQVGAGMGSWGTALLILDVYNTSTFTPPDAVREGDPEDFFFAGDVRDATAVLPGLRLQGRCTPINASSLDVSNPLPSFQEFCHNKIPNLPWAGDGNIAPGDLNVTMHFCNNESWASPFPDDKTTTIPNIGFTYYNYSSTGGSPPGSALIQCNSKMTTGTAVVSGTNHTYTSFSEQPLFNVSASTGGEPVLDPMFAMFYYLAAAADGAGDVGSMVMDAKAQGLEFQARTDTGAEETFQSPSPEDISAALWRATSHVTSGTAILSRSNDTSYPAKVTRTVSAYTRLTSFAVGAYILLAVWLLSLLCITAWAYRPTFSDSLDSYTAGRLISDRIDVVAGEAVGDADSNNKLGARFEPVRKDGTSRY